MLPPNGFGVEADAGAVGLAKKPGLLVGLAVVDAVVVGCEATGLPNVNVVEAAGAAGATGFADPEVAFEELVGNVSVDVFVGSAGLGAEDGIESDGKSEVEAFAVGAVVDVAGSENVVASLGASAGFAVFSVDLAAGAAGEKVEVAVVVAAPFFCRAASSALAFCLNLVIAAASRSCFSHFEYDFEDLTFGLSGAGGGA